MLTITLSVGDCGYFESAIRDAIEEIPGEEDVVVKVYEEDHKVVVKHINYASANQLVAQIYNKVGMRASVVSIVEEDDHEDEEEDDDEDDDDHDDEDDDDGGDEAEDDDETYVQLSSLFLYGTGLLATAISEPSWEEQPVPDPTHLFFYDF